MPRSKSLKQNAPRRRGRDRRVRIRSELRAQPDLQKIANTVLAMALAQAEKEAQAEAATREQEPPHE